MPEIPEMETYREMLTRTVVDKPIAGVTVERPRSINLPVEEFVSALVGKSVESITRRAKYLIFRLSGGLFMLSHLMLDGRLYYGPGKLPGKPHVVINFSDLNSLFFCEFRLGYLHLLTPEALAAETAGLGVEPLSPDFTWETFRELLLGRRGAVKPLLMEQKIIAGIGNAYSNEILFAAGILPGRTVPSINENTMRDLWQVIPQVLHEGIRNGGYIEEPYAQWDKLSGGQIPHFMVYDRNGQPCKVCGTVIQSSKLSGRWTYYCPACQR